MADLSWMSAEYADRKAAAESQVTQWVPYTDQAYAVDPLYFLALRFPVGERLDGSEGAAYWYGLDDSGRVWVERQGTTFEGRQYETFFVHGPFGPAELALFTYSPDKAAIRHEVFTYDEGRLATAEHQATGGCGRSRFSYEGERLVRVDQEHGESLDRLNPFVTIQVEYDEEGEIAKVTRGSEVAYRALPAGTSIEDIERAFVDRLVEAVPDAVTADPPPVRSACLALLYSPGQFAVLPPLLAFPTKEGIGGLVDLLTDADYHELDIAEGRAPELYELAGYLDQTRLADGRLQALLNEASQRLNELDWRSRLAVADDFLVFATDLEQVHLEKNLCAVTTPERAAQILDAVE